jgi:hypothetical protein
MHTRNKLQGENAYAVNVNLVVVACEVLAQHLGRHPRNQARVLEKVVQHRPAQKQILSKLCTCERQGKEEKKTNRGGGPSVSGSWAAAWWRPSAMRPSELMRTAWALTPR